MILRDQNAGLEQHTSLTSRLTALVVRPATKCSRNYLLLLFLQLFSSVFNIALSQNLMRDGDFEMLSPPEIGLAVGGNLNEWEVLTGSPDIYGEDGNSITFTNISPKSGRQYLNLLRCESIYQELTTPLLPNKEYYISLFTQSRSLLFVDQQVEGCGTFSMFGSKLPLENSVAQNGCASNSTSILLAEQFDILDVSQEWEGMFWCFTPSDTLYYFGLGIEVPDTCGLSILVDEVSLYEVIPGNGIFADLFRDSLFICPNASCTTVDVNLPYNFNWDDQVTGGVRELCNEGKFEVSYSTGGCLLQEDIWVHQPVTGGLLTEDNLTVCPDQSIEVSLDVQQEVRWSDGSQANTRILPQGSYEVSYQALGCQFVESLNIEEIDCAAHPIYMPNAFSPNYDGVNDDWQVLMQSDFFNLVAEAELLIFDRWGNLLVQKTMEDLNWDGRVNGRLMESGIYIYSLRYSLESFKEPFVQSGDFLLIN